MDMAMRQIGGLCMQYCRICIPKQYDLHHHNVMDETNCHKFGHSEVAVPT